MEKRISVILVNYNGKKYNDACIRSVLNNTVRDQIQVVIVDNASTDGSLEALRDVWGQNKQVHIIVLDQNLGFSKANNEGIRWSMEQGIEHFLLLNNDTETEKDTVERMFSCYQKTRGIVVPKVYYADRRDTVWCAGGYFTPVILKAVQRGLNQRDRKQLNQSRKCGFANGCAMLLSKEIVDRIGYLDERFFLYYEDTEYSMRAGRLQINIWYCAEAVVYHKVNGSTAGNEKPENAYYITRNWLLCNKIYMSKVRFAVFLVYFFCNRAAWMLIWLLKGRRKMCVAMMRGIKDFFCGRWGKMGEGYGK